MNALFRSSSSRLQARLYSSAVTPMTQIEARWTKLPKAEQGAIADQLAELQKGDWKKMTLEQKRAAYYIAYGGYGPRTPKDPTLTYKVLGWVSFFLAVTYVFWRKSEELLPKLRTQTPEWKAAQAELMIEQKQNPHSGPYLAHRLKNDK